MELTTKQLNLITISLTMFYDEVAKDGSSAKMKQDIKELHKLVNGEFIKSFSNAL
jgi:hypothetical protein